MVHIISKDFGDFAAAHQLPNHEGKCRNLHGHNYRVVGEFTGPLITTEGITDQGMVIDFGVVKEVYKTLIDARLDHSLVLGTVMLPWVQEIVSAMNIMRAQYEPDHPDYNDYVIDALNRAGILKVAILPIPVTTAEWLSRWIFEEMQRGLGEAAKVHSITVYETPSSFARFEGPLYQNVVNLSDGTIERYPTR